MLKSVRRWLFGPPSRPGAAALQAWCETRGWRLRAARESEGFVIEPPGQTPDWRIEWGPSQRAYLGTHELRLRGETGVDPSVQALVMPRAMMNLLERELFSQITDSVQTRVDMQTPEELRWLAMAERLPAERMGALQRDYAAVSNAPDWTAAWLAGGLRRQLMALAAAPADAWPQPVSLALVAQRGRLVLRLALPTATPEGIEPALALFQAALTQARQLPPPSE